MVRRNELRELLGALTGAAHSPRCDLFMLLDAQRLRKRVVGAVAQQGVAESELELVRKTRWVDRHNQFPKAQASKELSNASHRLPAHRCYRPCPKHAPYDRGVLEHPLLVIGKCIDPRRDQGLY